MPCLHFGECSCALLGDLSCVPEIGGQVGGLSSCVALTQNQAGGPICSPPSPLEQPPEGLSGTTCLAMLVGTARAACKVKVSGCQSQEYPWTAQLR